MLGFAKEILLANIFGPGRAVDAFQIAITIPQDLYDLAIFGHTNSALVPVLTEYAAHEDKAELWEVVSALASLVLLAAGLLVLGLVIFTPQVITLYRGTPDPGSLAEAFHLRGLIGHQGISALSEDAFGQTVDLLRLTAPALIFMSLFAVFSGTLFALKRFGRPAFGAAVFNGVIVLSTLALAPVIGIRGVALGWVAGAVAQLILQFGGLRGSHIRLVLAGLPQMLRHPGLRRIGLLYLPVLLTLLVDVAVNRPFSYNIASQTGEGNIGYMNWATSLREFPMGLVGTAISIAILPTLARQALRGDTGGSLPQHTWSGDAPGADADHPGGGGHVRAGRAAHRTGVRAWQLHRRKHRRHVHRAATVPCRHPLRGHRPAAHLRLLCAARFADTRPWSACSAWPVTSPSR